MKGHGANPCHNWPMGLTSVAGKCVEEIQRDRICVHVEKQGLITGRQHGFVRGISCLTNLIDIFEEVTSKIEGKAV